MYLRGFGERRLEVLRNEKSEETLFSRNYVYGKEYFDKGSDGEFQPKFFYEIYTRDGKYALAKPGREFLTTFEYDRIYPIAEGPLFNVVALESNGKETFLLLEEGCDYRDIISMNVLLYEVIPSEFFGEALRDFSLRALDKNYSEYISREVYNVIESTMGVRYDEDMACDIVNNARIRKNSISKSIEEKHEEYKSLRAQRENL